jgi:hypothetical protein
MESIGGFHIRQGCPTHDLSAQRLLLPLTIAASGLPLKHLPDIQYDRLSRDDLVSLFYLKVVY